MLWQAVATAAAACWRNEGDASRQNREKRGLPESWPEWCFPRVSMNIYLPGAYSDKSVIAAEASEKVARSRRCYRCRCHYHHHHHHPYHYRPPVAFATSTPHRGTPRRKHVVLPIGATIERDITLKSAVNAEVERQRRTITQTEK